ncbi:MAG: hypothetical protein NVSMB32_09970 [Actinomycetota bacterium]
MPTGAVPDFAASRDAFHFANAWPPQPDLTIDLPVAGTVGIGDASNGLCGGMAYAVRDFHEAKISAPADTSPPGPGTALYAYIVRRLFDSFDLPRGVLQYYAWMNSPGGDQSLLGMTRRGVAWKTIKQEWPKIKADIDGGHLSPLGLVTVQSVDPRALGRCHQVLAYAYQLDGTLLTLALYDPNSDPGSADSVTLSLDMAHPERAAAISHNVAIADPIRGFFQAVYTFSDPAVLGLAAQ